MARRFDVNGNYVILALDSRPGLGRRRRSDREEATLSQIIPRAIVIASGSIEARHLRPFAVFATKERLDFALRDEAIRHDA